MRLFVLGFALFLAACSQSAAPPADPAEAIVEVERAMAAEARQSGWVEAFLKYAADDAFVLQGGIQDAQDFYTNIDPANLGDTSLHWAPAFAGASASGDLGFTAGPFNGADTVFGYYFTVWRRQADGSLKWIYDGGVDTTRHLDVEPDRAVVQMAAASGEGSPEAARAAVAAAEEDLAAMAAGNVRAAYAEHVSETVRLNRENELPAESAVAVDSLLTRGPATARFRQIRAVASEAGDMVFTLGEARWTEGTGYYTRIWMREGDGWRIAFDQIVERHLPGAE